MANINLTTSTQEKEPLSFTMINGGLLVITIIFFLTVISYIGIILYSRTVKGHIDDVKNQYNASYESVISNNKAKDVADFQNRTDTIKKLLSSDSTGNVFEDFAVIEKIILPNVHIDSYAYDSQKNQVTLQCVADNYNTVAKQILSFKTFKDENNFSYFSVTKAGEATLSPDAGTVSFPVTLKINNKK